MHGRRVTVVFLDSLPVSRFDPAHCSAVAAVTRVAGAKDRLRHQRSPPRPPVLRGWFPAALPGPANATARPPTVACAPPESLPDVWTRSPLSRAQYFQV